MKVVNNNPFACDNISDAHSMETSYAAQKFIAEIIALPYRAFKDHVFEIVTTFCKA